tara:strand:- start:540 stop:899 length:360 start_codon:yes stop_codon:yes gene_type:complete
MEKNIIIDKIKSWLEIESKIIESSSKLRELRKTKKGLNEELLEIMKTNEIDCFDCNSGKIMYTKNKTKGPINKKYLEKILNSYCLNNNSNSEEATKLCEYILDNREIKINENIKLKQNK